MPSSIHWLLTVVALFVSENAFYANSFSVPDAFHMVHTATSSASTVQHQTQGMIHLLDVYKHSLLEHPLGTKMATGATMAVAGDAIAQSRDVNAPYDKRRATSFAFFDMAYRALQHAAFPVIVQQCHGQFLQSALSHVTLVDQHAAAAMEQTLASQLGIVPLFYYPAFFAVTGAVQGLDVEGSVKRAKDTFLPLMKRNLCFWIPVQFVQFGFVQEDLQIPFLSVCGLGWTFILSVYAGSAKSYATPTAVVEEEYSDPAEQMAMMAHAVTEEQYANAPEEEVMPEAASQAQQDETTSTGSRVAGRKLASSKV